MMAAECGRSGFLRLGQFLMIFSVEIWTQPLGRV
jgi:hypothetical protein